VRLLASVSEMFQVRCEFLAGAGLILLLELQHCNTLTIWLEEFVAHSSNVNCLKIGRKTSRVLVTGGEDHKVNLWAIGKPNSILVRLFYLLLVLVTGYAYM
jgi:WD40 repeat protein